MKRILVFGEDLELGTLLVELHADGIEAVTASNAKTARLALAQSDFDAVLGRFRDFAPNGALAACGERRLALVKRDELFQAKAELGTCIDDCLLLPVRAEELSVALHRRLAPRSGQTSTLVRDEIIGIDGGLGPAWATLNKAAAFDADVLITGESGTGKELFARALHGRSRRANGPFVAINCAAIPEGLLESQLFGHVRGAFTDAHADSLGVFARANGGTLFLDEIGDLASEMQVKLLRALQTREVQPLGSERSIPVDVRVVSATSRNLLARIGEGRFRDDLYYRLAVVPIELPALRERRSDLGPMIDHFLDQLGSKHQVETLCLAPEGRACPIAADWPGNVRELENTIERLVVLAEGGMISAELIAREVGPSKRSEREAADDQAAWSSHGLAPQRAPAFVLDGRSLKEAMNGAEALFIAEALRQCAGKRSKCAELLNISQRALLYKIKEHRL